MTVRLHVKINPSATCYSLNLKASFYLMQHKLTKIPEQVMHEEVFISRTSQLIDY